MGPEEDSSTDALATSSKILNLSYSKSDSKVITKLKHSKAVLAPASEQINNIQQNNNVGWMLHVWAFILTVCRVSIRSTPMILTAMSLWEATLILHWIGRMRALT